MIVRVAAIVAIASTLSACGIGTGAAEPSAVQPRITRVDVEPVGILHIFGANLEQASRVMLAEQRLHIAEARADALVVHAYDGVPDAGSIVLRLDAHGTSVHYAVTIASATR